MKRSPAGFGSARARSKHLSRYRLRKRYTAPSREEVRRTVSDPAEIDEEIHALCEALIASEGRLGP